MKQTAMLTTASLLNILLMTFHLTGDILFKMSPAGLSNLFAVFIFVVLLCGTLLLDGRRAGYIIIFFGSVLALVMAVLHHLIGARTVELALAATRVHYRLTPVADICRDRSCLTQRLREVFKR